MRNEELLQLEYLSKKYDENNIPLYLSYPTQSWWKDNIDEKTFINDFKNIKNPFLYFHFPYCQKACFYCACYKDVTDNFDKMQEYLEYLCKEFDNKVNQLFNGKHVTTDHMHWGGGTPTYMSIEQLEYINRHIIEKIKCNNEEQTSFSIEAFPDTNVLSPKKLNVLKNIGFNEISIGIQDFDQKIQNIINRQNSVQTVSTIINQCNKLGFRIHLDLCYGLPYQGLNEVVKTTKEVIKMKPDRVAVFPYAHYPNLFTLQQKIPAMSIPNSFMKVQLFIAIKELFLSNGYEMVGTDHFVKKGNSLAIAAKTNSITKDFMGYSVDERKQYLSFGKSAISFSGNRFYHNITTTKEYYKSIENKHIPLQNRMMHMLSEDDLIRHHIIQKHILSDFTIKKHKINQDFDISFDDYFETETIELERYAQDGLIDISSNEIAITSKGKLFARHIAHVFDKYYN